MNEINIDEYRSDQTIFNNIKEAIDVTRDYIEKNIPDVETMISQITDKTRSFNSNFDFERKEEQDNDISEQIQDLAHNDEILKNRRKDLENAYIASEKIKDTTDVMAQMLNDQGAILDDVEANVQETKQNTEKAKKEIIEADKISQGNRKRLFCLLFIIFVAVAGTAGIICALVFN